MSFRKTPHLGSTEYAPFELLFGQVMRLPFDASLQPKENLQRDAKQYMKDLLAGLNISTEIAKANDLHNQSKNKDYHDQHVRLPDFAVGDLVLLKNHRCLQVYHINCMTSQMDLTASLVEDKLYLQIAAHL